MANPAGFNWTLPTTNTDGTPLASGEVTGFDIGVRAVADATHGPGNYAAVSTVPGATTASEAFTALSTVLAFGVQYAAAIRTDAAPPYVKSDWTNEITFTIPAPQANPPSGFSVA